jgi:hypothetical protein
LTEHHSKDWRKAFHSFADFEQAPKPTFAIEGFLPNDCITGLGGLSGDGKTLIMLNVMRSLLSEKKDKMLWGHFKVNAITEPVVCITPETGIVPFKHRLNLFKLLHHVHTGRLLVYTLSKGKAPELESKAIKEAAHAGARFFLDPAIRFGEGQENSASDNQALAESLFALLRRGARSVFINHHSPKVFDKKNSMTLETVFRGSGDFGAMLDAAWGIRQLDARRNIIYIQNVKDRDFTACGPFQIIGRPFVDNEGTFLMHKGKEPGKCGILASELNRGGAPPEAKEAKSENIQRMRHWLEKDPKLSYLELQAKFKRHHKTLAESTLRGYMRAIKAGAK